MQTYSCKRNAFTFVHIWYIWETDDCCKIVEFNTISLTKLKLARVKLLNVHCHHEVTIDILIYDLICDHVNGSKMTGKTYMFSIGVTTTLE